MSINSSLGEHNRRYGYAGVNMRTTYIREQSDPESDRYQMVGEDGLQFDAPVPRFTLSMPRVLH